MTDITISTVSASSTTPPFADTLRALLLEGYFRSTITQSSTAATVLLLPQKEPTND